MALEKRAKAERERVNQPRFGAGLQSEEGGGVSFGDGQRGARLSSASRHSEETEKARQTLASLEQELTAIEKELASLEQRDGVVRKRPGRTKYSPAY